MSSTFWPWNPQTGQFLIIDDKNLTWVISWDAIASKNRHAFCHKYISSFGQKCRCSFCHKCRCSFHHKFSHRWAFCHKCWCLFHHKCRQPFSKFSIRSNFNPYMRCFKFQMIRLEILNSLYNKCMYSNLYMIYCLLILTNAY